MFCRYGILGLVDKCKDNFSVGWLTLYLGSLRCCRSLLGEYLFFLELIDNGYILCLELLIVLIELVWIKEVE